MKIMCFVFIPVVFIWTVVCLFVLRRGCMTSSCTNTNAFNLIILKELGFKILLEINKWDKLVIKSMEASKR